MGGLEYSDGLNFDIYILDLCEKVKPTSCEDLEDLSEDLHERIETAIQDYIYDDEVLNIEDYEPRY